MKSKKIDFHEFIATLFGIGHFSKMPGTLGSVAAFIMALALRPVLWAAIIVVIIMGTWSSDRYSKRIEKKDPQEVVIDEVAGMWISMCALPTDYGLPAFVLFRIIDIVKPFPVNFAEKLPGGIGIMADDIVGGIMTWLILYAIKVYIFV